MNRSEFIVATAVVLFVAFLFGWFVHWVVHRFTRIPGDSMGELDRLAQQLHEAEEERDQAITWFQDRESSMENKLAQSEAELRAAMEGLREARAEAEDLRAYVERMSAG